jgi:hypothetical protein
MVQTFELVSFPDPKTPEIRITGKISRDKNILAVSYLVSGKVGDILIPKAVSRPGRGQELWLTTCFEFFLAIPGQTEYWEFNLSPSGEWNVFYMNAYRRMGFREEVRIPELMPGVFLDESGSYWMSTVVDLHPIFKAEKRLQTGITTVIQTLDGHTTYWALAHPRTQADFHSRESFTLVLEGKDRL